MREENKEFLGIAMTAAVVAYWGFTTVLMKHALLYMSSVTYIMLRFCVAAVLVLAVYGRRLLRAASPSLLLHGLVLGLLELIPMECSVLALKYTSAANSVFISKLSFVIVPLMQCLLLRRLPDRRLVTTAAMLLLGLGIFSDVLGQGIGAGSLFSLVSALFLSVHILYVRRCADTDDPQLLGALQIVFCAVFSIPVWLLDPGGVNWCGGAVWVLFFTAVIGTAVAFVVHTAGEILTTPVKVSFLGLLQPVFAMLGGAVIADEFGNREPITANMLLGAAVILPALIWYIRSTTGSAGTVSRSA